MPTIGSLRIELFLDMARYVENLEKSTKLLNAKAKEFEKIGKDLSVAITAPIVAAGLAAGAGANKIDEALDHIRATTGKTGEAMRQLGADFRQVFGQVPDSADKVSVAIAELNSRVGLIGRPLQEMALQMVNVARITRDDLNAVIVNSTRVFASWHVALKDQPALLDTFFKISQRTGIGVSALTGSLAASGAQLREMGFSVEQAAALLGTFEKEGVNAESALAAMKRGVADFAKAGLDAPAALRGVIKQIHDMADASKANALAVQFFGARAGIELAQAIKQGRFALDDFLKSVHDSPETINSAAKQVESFSEKWDLLKNKVELALEPLGKKLLDIFNEKMFPAFETGIEKLGKFAEEFANLPEPIQTATIGFATMAAVAGPLLLTLSGLISAAGKLAPILAAVAPFVPVAVAGIAAAWSVGNLKDKIAEIFRYNEAVAEANKQGADERETLNAVALSLQKYGIFVDGAASSNEQMAAAIRAGAEALLAQKKAHDATVSLPALVDPEFEARVQALIKGFRDAQKEMLAYSAAIKILAKTESPKDLVEKFGQQLEKLALQGDAAALAVLRAAHAISEANLNRVQQAFTGPRQEIPLTPAGLQVGLAGIQSANDLDERIKLLQKLDDVLFRLEGRHIGQFPVDQLVSAENDHALETSTRFFDNIRAVAEFNEKIRAFVNRDSLKDTLLMVRGIVAGGGDLVEIYRQFGGLLDTYPEKLDKSTKAALENGKVLTIIKDGWVNVGRAIEQSVSKAVQNFTTLKDAAKSIFNAIKAALLQMIGDVIGAMVRRLFNPLLTAMAGAFPSAIGAAGAAAAGGGVGAAGGGIVGGGGGFSALWKALSGGAGGFGGAASAIGGLAAPIGLAAVLSGNQGAQWGGLAGAGFFGGAGLLGGLSGGALLASFIGGAGIGGAVGLAITALIKAFTKTPTEAGAKEVGRDFGGVSAGPQTISDFLSSMGITEEMFKPIRKDIFSSPAFLTRVAYPLAVQQGKTEEFLQSLEQIKTVMGTFNFRSAFEQGLKTGDFTALNKQFVDAFKNSQALVQIIPDFATRLAAATNGALDAGVVRTRLEFRSKTPGGVHGTGPGPTGGTQPGPGMVWNPFTNRYEPDPCGPDGELDHWENGRPVCRYPNREASAAAQTVVASAGSTSERPVQIVYAPRYALVDGADIQRLEREKIFPDFIRHVDGNLGNLKAKLKKAMK